MFTLKLAVSVIMRALKRDSIADAIVAMRHLDPRWRSKLSLEAYERFERKIVATIDQDRCRHSAPRDTELSEYILECGHQQVVTIYPLRSVFCDQCFLQSANGQLEQPVETVEKSALSKENAETEGACKQRAKREYTGL